VSGVEFTGLAIIGGFQGHHQIKAQLGKVGKVIAVKSVATKNGVNVSQASKIALPASGSPNIWEINFMGITDKNVFNLPAAIDEYPYLTSNFAADG
jgi:hypothetical protein